MRQYMYVLSSRSTKKDLADGVVEAEGPDSVTAAVFEHLMLTKTELNGPDGDGRLEVVEV